MRAKIALKVTSKTTEKGLYVKYALSDDSKIPRGTIHMSTTKHAKYAQRVDTKMNEVLPFVKCVNLDNSKRPQAK